PLYSSQPSFPDPSSLSPIRRKLARFPDTILLLLPPSPLFPLPPVFLFPRPLASSQRPSQTPFSLFPSSSLLPDHSPVFFLLLTPFCICDCCDFEFGWSDAQVMKLMQREPMLLHANIETSLKPSESDVRENIMHLSVFLISVVPFASH
ncbi:unnamed protein product, partial [Musa textilis]